MAVKMWDISSELQKWLNMIHHNQEIKKRKERIYFMRVLWRMKFIIFNREKCKLAKKQQDGVRVHEMDE
jgi:hypothetical protein